VTATPTGPDPGLAAVAVVLTHNAPESLDRCLRAIAAQTTPPQAVLVVDNASSPPVDPSDAPPGCPPLLLVRSDHNGGPAGGYAIALARFLATPYRHAWVLDDDMRPDPTCLERGFLIAREIVEEVGLPRPELFWWAEDTEYLQWRIPAAGYPMRVVADAAVHHDAIRQGAGVPVWKYYYEARNMLWVHLYVKRRVGRYPRNVTKLLGRALLREPEGRVARLRAIGLGLHDGARGRLGTQFPIESMQERKGALPG